ncbi:DGQHR domain-containing protein [Pseudomonas sp.]|uniref:DGQHR domain-containing protein n=1 Tax=Pseudomonas sp. TaxID=306 RepID=UPI003D0AE246
MQKIFEGAGFLHVHADDLHFTMAGRLGEIDHIFVWENVVLLCEETTEAHATKHCTNKIFFHRKIADNYTGFFNSYCETNQDLAQAISFYDLNDLEVRHVYFSEKSDVVDSLGDSAPFRILTRGQAKYFVSLVETIERSAKYELLKYLDIGLHRIGTARVAGSSVSSNGYPAFALPAAHTSYPSGFAVVSFYADPLALIQRAYVLRRDGWEDPDLSYQRFVKADKLIAMREYLAGNGKVFINNLVVTLPSSALLIEGTSKPINPNSLKEKTSVSLHLPLELGTVGIVDGQHRILSYYEGSGPLEQSIVKLRQRQNLLVTGIIFPSTYTAEMRVKFEAEIFLGINNNQSPVHTQLRQDLETIINPETPLAIARAIVTRLSKEGPLAGKLQMSQFDPADKISSGSLGPYVVKVLTGKKSAFYKTWDTTGERDLAIAQDREEFVDYCVQELRNLLEAAAQHLKHKWKSIPNGGVLSTTAVGGLILLLERLAKDTGNLSKMDYAAKLKKIANFEFEAYTGSSWGKLATELHAFL